LIAVVVLPTPPFWLAMARQMASDIENKTTAKRIRMQTGDRWELWKIMWNAGTLRSVPRGTSEGP
jgi:hypothetical protein